MALKGELTGSCDNSSYKLTCQWSATQSVTNNTSTITAQVYLVAPSGWSTQSASWSCVINGTTVTSGKSITVGSTAVLLGSRTWTVTHGSDGKLSTTISFSYSNSLASKGTYTTKTGSGSSSVTLDQIARTSSFTLSSSSLDMGSSQTVTISRASSSFTHTIEYTFGGTTTTAASKTDKTSYSFTPPIDLANKITSATSGTCTVKVTTYSGSTSIGSASKTFTLKVPSSVKPTVTIAPTYNNTLNSLSIAGKTTVKVTPTFNGSYGSTLKSFSYSGAGLSGTGNSKTTGTLNAGSYTITVTATDSRGRTGSSTVSFTVYGYSSPSCKVSAYRADSNGNASASGTYARLNLTWNISNPNSANTNAHTYKVEYKKSTDSSWTTIGSGTTNPSYVSTGTNYNPGVSVPNTSSYDFRFTVTDSYGSASAIAKISTISCIFNVEKGGVGVGKIYEKGALDISGDVYAKSLTCNNNGKNAVFGAGASDVYIHNSVSGKYLQLKDDGTLTYSSGTSPSVSGNRWGTLVGTDSNGVMEIGKYIDFHETDGDTSDYSTRITSSNGDLYTSADALFMNGSTIKLGYSVDDACTYISNANSNWLRLKDDGGMTWKGYDILHSNGTHKISGTLKTGGYGNNYHGVTFKRKTDEIGSYLGKIGCSSISSTDPTVTIEIGIVSDTTNDTYADGYRRFSFSPNYFLTHTNNTVNIGSSTYRFKAVYATNGTIQTSDGRYKFILEDINAAVCYTLIKDTNLYGYSTLNKRIDEYTDMAEISDELQESSSEDMNLHMGIVAQDIEDNELAKYILTKDELEDEDGNPTGEYIYGIDNYAYTTAIHGALKYEMELREQECEALREENKKLQEQVDELEERLAQIEKLLGVR